MAKASCYLCLALAASTLSARAGNNDGATPAERKEFHQQGNYPYVFQPVAYLSAQGPVPLRFGVPADDGARHNPPALPAPKPSPTPSMENKQAKIAAPADNAGQSAQPSPSPAKPSPAPVQQSSPAASPSPAPPRQSPPAAQQSSAPQYPPPQDAPAIPSSNQPDFTQMPDEVVEFFRNPYTDVPNAHRFLDPLFEPAIVQKAPASKATYKQE